VIRRLLPLLAFLLLGGLLYAGVRLSADADREAIDSPLLGRPAPAFALPVFGDPQRLVRRDDLLGRPYLLNVWGSWCFACREEHPVITELARGGAIRVIGYNYKDEPAEAERWLRQYGNPYELILVDASGAGALDFGIYGAPESFLVDAEGIVRWKHVGPLTPAVVNNQLMPALRAAEPGR
jgi:cytochrome c biogenesis protein CcmG/thiol:disulfide interchange protein DsbE